VTASEMRSPHWSFWAIVIVTLLFNLAGCVNFVMQMTSGSLALMPEAVRELVGTRPFWATAGFAAAVFGAVIGGILLLARKSFARYLFGLSAVGACVTLLHLLAFASGGADSMEFVIGNLSQLVVSVFLLWYAAAAARRRWLG
jgi:hypothetical protein